jgi:hypothetical protein
MADEKARLDAERQDGGYLFTGKPLAQAPPPGLEPLNLGSCAVRDYIATLQRGSRNMAAIFGEAQDNPGYARQQLLVVKRYVDFALAQQTERNLPGQVSSCSKVEQKDYNDVIKRLEALGRSTKESLGNFDTGQHTQKPVAPRGTAPEPGRDTLRSDAASCVSPAARKQVIDRISNAEQDANKIAFNLGTAKANNQNGFFYPKQFQGVKEHSESVLAGLKDWKSTQTIKTCLPQYQKRFQDVVRKLSELYLEAQEYLPRERRAGNEIEATPAAAVREALLRYSRATSASLSQSPEAASMSTPA